ncbi:MAG: hypothetical protein ACHP6I_00150 [Rickettsiales bacterium]
MKNQFNAQYARSLLKSLDTTRNYREVDLAFSRLATYANNLVRMQDGKITHALQPNDIVNLTAFLCKLSQKAISMYKKSQSFEINKEESQKTKNLKTASTSIATLLNRCCYATLQTLFTRTELPKTIEDFRLNHQLLEATLSHLDQLFIVNFFQQSFQLLGLIINATTANFGLLNNSQLEASSSLAFKEQFTRLIITCNSKLLSFDDNLTKHFIRSLLGTTSKINFTFQFDQLTLTELPVSDLILINDFQTLKQKHPSDFQELADAARKYNEEPPQATPTINQFLKAFDLLLKENSNLNSKSNLEYYVMTAHLIREVAASLILAAEALKAQQGQAQLEEPPTKKKKKKKSKNNKALAIDQQLPNLDQQANGSCGDLSLSDDATNSTPSTISTPESLSITENEEAEAIQPANNNLLQEDATTTSTSSTNSHIESPSNTNNKILQWNPNATEFIMPTANTPIYRSEIVSIFNHPGGLEVCLRGENTFYPVFAAEDGSMFIEHASLNKLTVEYYGTYYVKLLACTPNADQRRYNELYN